MSTIEKLFPVTPQERSFQLNAPTAACICPSVPITG